MTRCPYCKALVNPARLSLFLIRTRGPEPFRCAECRRKSSCNYAGIYIISILSGFGAFPFLISVQPGPHSYAKVCMLLGAAIAVSFLLIWSVLTLHRIPKKGYGRAKWYLYSPETAPKPFTPQQQVVASRIWNTFRVLVLLYIVIYVSYTIL